jgi:hypothetical protein
VVVHDHGHHGAQVVFTPAPCPRLELRTQLYDG